MFELLTPNRIVFFFVVCFVCFLLKDLNLDAIKRQSECREHNPKVVARRLSINLCYVTIENPSKMFHTEARLN